MIDGGDNGEIWEQADVPGSSDPSGQSQKSSFTCATSSLMDGLRMQENEVESL